MKKMSQKTASLLAVLAFMFVGLIPISAQNPPINGVVIIDDVSGIKRKPDSTRIIHPLLQQQGVKVEGSTTTFKGIVTGFNQSSVQIEIREMSNQALVKSISVPIINRNYIIPNVDISMCILDKYYSLTIKFIGTGEHLPLVATIRFKRSSGINKNPSGVVNNN